MSCPGGCPRNDRHPPVYQVDKTGICGCPEPVDPASIRPSADVCCPPAANNNPRRFEVYCPPVVSRAEPMSHGEYMRRLKSRCCVGGVAAPVPSVHPIGHRLDNTGRAEVTGAIAGRSALSHYDQGQRAASLTTLKAQGGALAADICSPCEPRSGTTDVIPGLNGCC
jgi:hypothetical protein